MKIISKGVLPEDRDEKLEGTCPNCLCKVQFTSKEAENREGNFGIQCPTKGCEHYIVGQKVTDDIWKAVEKRIRDKEDRPPYCPPVYLPTHPVNPFYRGANPAPDSYCGVKHQNQ